MTTYDDAVSPSLAPHHHQQPQQQPSSPWHSPIPYMFGGLAAMLGLIAFALLILACSYWKVSDGGRNDLDEGRDPQEKGSSLDVEKPVVMLEQKVVVIMAGELLPTYIATPVCAKAVCRGAPAAEGEAGGKRAASDGDGEKKDASSHSHVVIDVEDGS
ncbi:hypothetical protein MLD38_014003 [Melastoma candidum]|uniref:Uncharacterized protein n=1 Tax=Melastoma candidum TaxID=119954 RepID=A0ACB9RAR7_9MYRT|nr:hypothetical protein MLD38_014003 [Melastoma candidum]